VIQIEQHRAPHQNAAKVYLPDFRGSELSLIARSLPALHLETLFSRGLEMGRILKVVAALLSGFGQKVEATENKQLNLFYPGPQPRTKKQQQVPIFRSPQAF
jgi:hypothetical protein